MWKYGLAYLSAVVRVHGLDVSGADEVYECACCVCGLFAADRVYAEPVCGQVVDNKDVFVFCDTSVLCVRA